MANKQLVLDLPNRTARGRDDFLVAPCNEEAIALVDGWAEWAFPVCAIWGPRGCGKTHLAHVWSASSDAAYVLGTELETDKLEPLLQHKCIVVDDADQVPEEEALFHLYNSIKNAGGGLLLTGERAPNHWDVSLPDLRSRLGAVIAVELKAPDEMVIQGLLVKMFNDRQIDIDPKLVTFLCVRLERSFDVVADVVKRLDQAALAEKAPITVPFARKVLDL